MRAALLTDDELLTTPDPEAFGVFYARHRAGVEAYFTRRVRYDAAHDLTAETFASALVARRRFSPGPTPAAGWLLHDRGAEAHRLPTAQRRRTTNPHRARIMQRARRQPRAGAVVPGRRSGRRPAPPPAKRPATRHPGTRPRGSRLLPGRGTGQHVGGVHPAARVARPGHAPPTAAPAPSRTRAREPTSRLPARSWPSRDLRSISAQEALDCSAAASLILHQAGLLASDTASTSRLLAETWGEPGEGRYVTLWANDDHVWFEFNLEHDHAERFDPTPRLLAPSGRWTPTARDPTRDFAPRHWPGT